MWHKHGRFDIGYMLYMHVCTYLIKLRALKPLKKSCIWALVLTKGSSELECLPILPDMQHVLQKSMVLWGWWLLPRGWATEHQPRSHQNHWESWGTSSGERSSGQGTGRYSYPQNVAGVRDCGIGIKRALLCEFYNKLLVLSLHTHHHASCLCLNVDPNGDATNATSQKGSV